MATRKYHRKSKKIFRKTRSKRQRGGDQEETDKELLEAVKNNKLDEVKKALDAGANVNAKGDDGNTALIFAGYNGHTESVKLLLNRGADVNAKNNTGYTALIWASEKGHKYIVEKLLEEGADVNAKANIGWTALSLAKDRGHTEIVAMLEEAIANNTENNSSEGSQEEKDKELLEAVKNNKLDEVKKALDAGANVNATNNDGNTALIQASQNGHTEIVAMLLEKGADVNASKGKGGDTALIRASYEWTHRCNGNATEEGS